jgi:hypothetical protein
MGYPQYPAQQQQMAPQFMPPQIPGVAPMQAPPAGATFNDPGRAGGLAPAIRNMEGRVVIFRPHRVDESSKDPSGNVRPTAYTDVVVVDGGPMRIGDKQLNSGEPMTPHTHVVQTPCRFENIMVSNSNVVDALRGFAGRGLVVGLIERSTVGRKPWNLVKLDPNDPRRSAAESAWFAAESGQLATNVPQPLAPPVQQGQVPYAASFPQQQAPMQYQYPPQQPMQQQAMAQQYAPQSAPPAPATGGAPAGWDPSVWSKFTGEQQAAILAQGQPQQAMNGPATPGI